MPGQGSAGLAVHRGFLVKNTPKGFRVFIPQEGRLRAGMRVEVVASKNPLDWPYRGTCGTFLGYSIPHGYAVVVHEGGDQEDCFYSDSLEVILG